MTAEELKRKSEMMTPKFSIITKTENSPKERLKKKKVT